MNEADALHAIALRAVELIPDGSAIGLGTGHAATAFLHALAERVRAGLQVRGVPTSLAAEALARELGIPLTTLAADPQLELDVDGADEVDPAGDLIKGYGAGLVREKIVAASSKRLVILVGPEKLVPVLGTRGKLPIEVIPFGLSYCERALTALGCPPALRLDGQHPLTTDNGNHIFDCRIGPQTNPASLEQAIRAIPGVVGTGFFLGMKPIVLVAESSNRLQSPS